MKFLLYLIYIYIYNKNFINILIMFITKKNVKKILKNNTGTTNISIIQSKTSII